MADSLPSLEALAAAAIATNDSLRTRLQTLVSRMLDEADDILYLAPPAAKAALVRSFIPEMMKHLREETEDAAITALRQEQEALRIEVAEALLAGRTLLTAAPLVTDADLPMG